ncbi:sodium- and chloride-dependent glycine transporter 1-like [Tachypleus tridentatus]|uniref:sodium- and chloride-dependent glycine transporter 1-like n=1 Tax=Tachypleus tridentatus TaxID=6853 RepID=UPI003FD1A679
MVLKESSCTPFVSHHHHHLHHHNKDDEFDEESLLSKSGNCEKKGHGNMVDDKLALPSCQEDMESTVTENSDDSYETDRGNWSNKLDYILASVGYAVGLGNVWRFPYLCYRSGGGAFLIPYILFLVICGMPLFILENCFGQFASLGPVSIWKISPMFKGVGYAMVLVSGIVCIYYNVIIAWTLYYLYKSVGTVVPWATCGNWWNTIRCVDHHEQIRNISLGLNDTVDQNITTIDLSNRMTSSEEYWLFYVLRLSDGIEEFGEPRWPLVLSLFVAWMIVFLCLIKGVQSSGKVVYISATFPYIILIVLFIRGVTLPGSLKGIMFYLTPRWELLKSFEVWADAATQIFYSVGTSWGAVLTMASYNRFNNNCYRDAILIPVVNCCTSIFAGFVVFSIIGFMSYETGKSIEDVVSQGPGLAFVVYPEAVARLPISPLWGLLFFTMLFTIGLDTQFGMFEALVSSFVDEFPTIFKNKKMALTGFMSFVLFLLGIFCVTRGGMYFLQLMDWYSATFSLMIIALFETIVISWVYGIDRFMLDINLMLNRTLSLWWKLCWCYITPITIFCLLLFIMINHTTITYNKYVYPSWSVGLGWCIAMSSLVPIPGYAVFHIYKAKGTFKQRLLECLRPAPEWGPALSKHRLLYKESLSLMTSRFNQIQVANLPNSASSTSCRKMSLNKEPTEEIIKELPPQYESMV